MLDTYQLCVFCDCSKLYKLFSNNFVIICAIFNICHNDCKTLKAFRKNGKQCNFVKHPL